MYQSVNVITVVKSEHKLSMFLTIEKYTTYPREQAVEYSLFQHNSLW